MIICDYCKKHIKEKFVSFETSIFEEGSGDTMDVTEHLHRKCAEKIAVDVSRFIDKELEKKCFQINKK